MRLNLQEVYKNSGLGKWFHGESATKEPGWDRYNSEGERVGKCGDAKEGSAYSACLSKQKASKLGKEGIASFVNRKRKAQSKKGRGKKGTGKKGKKPIFVKTGASKNMNEHNNLNEGKKLINLSHSVKAAKKIAKHHGIDNTKTIATMASKLRTAANHGGMSSRISRLATGTTKSSEDKSSIIATLSKRLDLPYDKEAHSSGSPKINKEKSKLRVPAEGEVEHKKGLNENCGCDETPEKKILNKIKKKYLNETSVWKINPNNKTNKIILEDFTELNLNRHVNQKVLVETDTGVYFGKLVLVRENCAIVDASGIVKKIFDPAEVTKLVANNETYVISEGANKPNDTEAWSDCKSQAKKKFDVYPSAYANAWAAKCYKKKGGTWRKSDKKKLDESINLEEEIHKKGSNWVVTDSSGEKVLGTHNTKEKAVAQLGAIEASKARRKNMSENVSLLLKEKIKHIFFKEEIVNPENEFTMTNAEIQERDKRAEAMLSSSNFSPQLKKGDTKEEAAHRIATAAVIDERGGKGYEPGLFGGEDERKSEKYSRRKTRDLRRLTRGDKAEQKYDKGVRSKRNREKTAKNPSTKERRSFANVERTKGERFTKASKARDEQTVSRSRYRKND
jgi:hypothetical protein